MNRGKVAKLVAPALVSSDEIKNVPHEAQPNPRKVISVPSAPEVIPV